MRSHCGFTLLELILVMLLVGALGAIAMPAFVDQSAFGGQTFRQDVLAALRHAQRTAIASGCEVRYRNQGNAYALHYRSGGSDTACGSGGFDEAVLGADGRPYVATAPQGVALPDFERYFDAQGRPHTNTGAAAGGSFTLAGRAVTVEADSGHAH